jgi:hypothetical protein
MGKGNKNGNILALLQGCQQGCSKLIDFDLELTNFKLKMMTQMKLSTIR